ncbi:MAG: glutamate--cysteine ligase [Candidatus Marinamargulisbacteria bacterium]
MIDVKQEVKRQFNSIEEWLQKQKQHATPLLYSSIDIRESNHKLAGIDTNVFPAGFNNLNPNAQLAIRQAFKRFFSTHYPISKEILLFCEDHTRNLFYLENVYQLKSQLESAGCNVIVGSFFKDHPTICTSTGHLTITTANNNPLTLYCLNYILNHRNEFNIDACVLNNDLSDGNYDSLTQLNVPIIPDPQMGWHRRKKSTHIAQLNQLTKTLIDECHLSIDPWQLTTEFAAVSSIDINLETDRQRLADTANDILKIIQQKYKEHHINDSPYLVIKSDNGTYGMGVISIKEPNDILNLNRKSRNKLHKGKSAIPIDNLIIQEGIPSAIQINGHTAEEVIYHVNGETIGSFYRLHEQKTTTDILNSKGMQFKAFDPSINESFQEESTNAMIQSSPISYLVAQLANLSAQKEVALL